MHARTIIAVQRLGHERDALVVLVSDVLDDVLVHHQLVSHFDHLIKLEIDFALAGSRHFVMLAFDVQTAVDHRLHHFVADVHQLVGWRTGEVTLLVPNLVAEVGVLFATAIPFCLDAVEMKKPGVRVLIKADIIEDEKFSFRAKIDRVGQTCPLQIGTRLAGHVPRVATVVFPGDRILNVADHDQRRQLGKRVEKSRRRIGNEQHVALVDLLPTPDAGAIKALAVVKRVFRQLMNGNRCVLPCTDKIHKAEIDRLHTFFATERENFLGSQQAPRD